VKTWHVITGEYPPQTGGVSDYTRQLARGLVDAGDRVELEEAGIVVHRLPDRFGLRSFMDLTKQLRKWPAPRRLLVQYVPQAFGLKGANLPFCIWLWLKRRESIWVMFHEVMFVVEGDGTVLRSGLARVHRLMASLVSAAAERAFIAIPGWGPLVEPLLREGASVTWLPIPSSIPVVPDPAATAAVRSRYAAGHPLVGHFGTYGRAVGALLERTLEDLATLSDCHILLMGDRSDDMCRAMRAAHPALAGRLFATGRLAEGDISHHVAACDLMLQPYPDGISSRRTSAMVALSHGRALVTTAGWLTEPMWAESRAAVLVPVDDSHALAAAAATILFDVSQRQQIGRRAAELYDARFHVRHAVSALRSLSAI
jgi:hypothetical protein